MERRRLVDTASSVQPPMDVTEVRWRERPVLAACIRTVVIAAPLVAATAAGIAASRAWRPIGPWQTVGWLLWTGIVSVAVLTVADAAARRLLPLQRLLQLCLVFPDRAPSRLRLAVRAARTRRPEQLAHDHGAPADAAAAAARIVELLAALATHDRRTRGHSERVCAYTNLLAEQMNLSQRDRDRLMWVALVHDIGKLHVPTRLLNKPARPTVPEWRVLQAHPEHGHRITEPLRAWLGPWGDTVLQHHERWDGAGYPQGLAGDEICLGARILAVTDAFEVMTAPRPYRRPVDSQSARAELARHAGTQFDPEVVRQFLAVGLPELRRSMGLLAWIAQIPFLRSWPKLQSAAGVTTAQATAATAAAATAGLLFAPVPNLAVAEEHDAAAAPSSPQALQPEGPVTSVGGTVAELSTATTPASPSGTGDASPRNAAMRADGTTTGEVTAAATVTRRHAPPTASTTTTTPTSSATPPASRPDRGGADAETDQARTPDRCAPGRGPGAHEPHGHGHHYGWAKQQQRRDGCD